MAEEPRSAVDIRDFLGIITESDENDMNPGASPEQVNCTSDDVGVLRSRRGFLPVSFES